MLKTKKSKKRFLILLLVIVLLFCLGLYIFFINPEDEVLKKRCTGGYNQNSYQLFSSEQYEIEIPENSCLIGECCQYNAVFRSKKSIEELKNDLKKVEEDLKEKYLNIDFEFKVKDRLFFREYNIHYNIGNKP